MGAVAAGKGLTKTRWPAGRGRSHETWETPGRPYHSLFPLRTLFFLVAEFRISVWPKVAKAKTTTNHPDSLYDPPPPAEAKPETDSRGSNTCGNMFNFVHGILRENFVQWIQTLPVRAGSVAQALEKCPQVSVRTRSRPEGMAAWGTPGGVCGQGSLTPSPAWPSEHHRLWFLVLGFESLLCGAPGSGPVI